MQTINQYCSVCASHTEHKPLTMQYADVCLTCNTHTSRFIRVQDKAMTIDQQLIAPDGTPAEIVENTPVLIVFHVPAGPHRGYYEYDKRTREKRIRS